MTIPTHRSHPFRRNSDPIERNLPTDHSREADWPRHAPRNPPALLLANSVARISDAELQAMDRNDLIEVAHCASSALPRQEFLQHLPFMTYEQLRQLACLARRTCRLQVQPGIPLR